LAGKNGPKQQWERLMFAIAGLIGVTAGTVLACVSVRFRRHAAVIETIGGVMMIGGFALVGWTLPAIV
jgi:hypothetical protein